MSRIRDHDPRPTSRVETFPNRREAIVWLLDEYAIDYAHKKEIK